MAENQNKEKDLEQPVEEQEETTEAAAEEKETSETPEAEEKESVEEAPEKKSKFFQRRVTAMMPQPVSFLPTQALSTFQPPLMSKTQQRAPIHSRQEPPLSPSPEISNINRLY